MPLEELPPVDEHSLVVGAPPPAVWTGVLEVLGSAFGTGTSPALARLLGCEPSATTAWGRAGVGSTVPGFRVVAARPPRLLVLAGRHRFARYAIVARVEPCGSGSRLGLETRAAFPGLRSAAYRLAVIGTGGHVLVTRRLLRQVARAAERAAAGPGAAG
ncbi:hypothetical protein [Geodermatophilus marinus]|uniref:hypothetical protein n=1 Tax=Geodermatophilus sp. LHW52908 TaxID=2303986 RepID=UPI000E3BE5A5|nr:hypothetical protein [Geodermatophilus sp. LHW52908]RFU20784.1 hypothetical protein D0Z06_14675 [Geodermatophilus sp. LHW52908]